MKLSKVKIVPGGGDIRLEPLVTASAGLDDPLVCSHKVILSGLFSNLDFVFLRLKSETQLVAIVNFYLRAFQLALYVQTEALTLYKQVFVSYIKIYRSLTSRFSQLLWKPTKQDFLKNNEINPSYYC